MSDFRWITRRDFLTYSGLVGAAAAVAPHLRLYERGGRLRAVVYGGGTLSPGDIGKFVSPLVVPPVMPRTRKLRVRGGKNIDEYAIAVRQFRQQVLPAGHPTTTVWGYGSPAFPGTFGFPSPTIEAKWESPVRVRWINDLRDSGGRYLPHLLPVDQTVHWANPPGPVDSVTSRPEPYLGPVPLVTHVHGAHTTEDSDGYPEAWYLPDASDIPPGHGRAGSVYGEYRAAFRARTGVDWAPGSATFDYPNDQAASTLWYHDHTLGMTRLNVYAGPAGFYLLRGGPSDEVAGTLPGPAPALGDPPGVRYYEIPLAIQDRSFNADGSLFYPDSRSFFDGFSGPYVPDSDISPLWNPEFFADTMLVNGRTWPFLEVERRRYRFRLLNGCNSRFLILRMTHGATFWQIGSEQGFLPAPVQIEELLLAPAERADVIVDFSGLPEGAEVMLQNLGPDEPFGGGMPDVDFEAAHPDGTGQVMVFRVVPARSRDLSTPPDQLGLPLRPPTPVAATARRVSLNEVDSEVLEGVGPRAAFLGEVHEHAGMVMGMPMMWGDPVTENPAVGATEVWEVYNFTMDAHPIHIHQVAFEVVDREPGDFGDMEGGMGGMGGMRMSRRAAASDGGPRPPEPNETGLKDTVIAYPGEITRLKATFDLPGRFVWHCHIVEHEDNEMMRPFRVGP